MRLLSILAAALVLVDGYYTQLRVRYGHREINRARRFLIYVLGPNVGTLGVALGAAVALLLAWDPILRASGIAWTGFLYAAVCSIYAYASVKAIF